MAVLWVHSDQGHEQASPARERYVCVSVCVHVYVCLFWGGVAHSLTIALPAGVFSGAVPGSVVFSSLSHSSAIPT